MSNADRADRASTDGEGGGAICKSAHGFGKVEGKT